MADYTTRVTKGDLFSIFLRAGLAFGGGLGILAVLEQELVNKRSTVTADEFLTIYGIGRIVPSGTMTALAVACSSLRILASCEVSSRENINPHSRTFS